MTLPAGHLREGRTSCFFVSQTKTCALAHGDETRADADTLAITHEYSVAVALRTSRDSQPSGAGLSEKTVN